MNRDRVTTISYRQSFVQEKRSIMPALSHGDLKEHKRRDNHVQSSNVSTLFLMAGYDMNHFLSSGNLTSFHFVTMYN